MKIPDSKKRFEIMKALNPYIWGGMFAILIISFISHIAIGDWSEAFWILIATIWAGMFVWSDRFLSKVLKSYGDLVEEYVKVADLLKELSDKLEEAEKNENKQT